jgi:hypothetical protein
MTTAGDGRNGPDEGRERYRFQVTGHYEVRGRGAVVIGLPMDGLVGVGMRARAGPDFEILTVSTVEFVDSLCDRKHWIALFFAEKPPLDGVREAFPIGSVLELEPRRGRSGPSGDRPDRRRLSGSAPSLMGTRRWMVLRPELAGPVWDTGSPGFWLPWTRSGRARASRSTNAGWPAPSRGCST